jgi:SAM-dependent methyltransferase
MSDNKVNIYDIDAHIAEIYDQQQNYSDDVQLLLDLIGQPGSLRIFEPFCGTGRILIPLVIAGHQVIGLDQSKVLLSRCKEKLSLLGKQATLIEGDAVADPWPDGLDLVILGGNCLYELANADEQERCIQAAASALKPGGFLFLDNDHMEGLLAQNWQDSIVRPSFPSGNCMDGVRLESTIQTIWVDVSARLARFRRQTRAIFPDGQVSEQTYFQQKHPVSTSEVRFWLEKHGFTIEQLYGARKREPYMDTSPRAIFWAKNRIQ